MHGLRACIMHEVVRVQVDLPAGGAGMHAVAGALHAEEVGLMLEVAAGDAKGICDAYRAAGVPAAVIGATTDTPAVSISVGARAPPFTLNNAAFLLSNPPISQRSDA